MNQLQSALQRSLTIDVSGLRSGFWQAPAPLQPALPHYHSAPVAEADHGAAAASSQPAKDEPLEALSEACQHVSSSSPNSSSPFCTQHLSSEEVHSALALGRRGDSNNVKHAAHGSCSEPVAQTPHEDVGFAAPTCSSFPPYFPSLGGLGSHNYETSIMLPGCIPFGVKAVCGKRAKMEDAFQALPFFFDLPAASGQELQAETKLPARIAVQLEQSLAEAAASSSQPSASSSSVDHPLIAYDADTLHFFGVYDGHGGCEAAQHCASRLHHHLSEALSQARSAPGPGGPSPAEAPESHGAGLDGTQATACSSAGSEEAGSLLEACSSGSSYDTARPQNDGSQASCDSQVSPQTLEEANLSEGSSGASSEAPGSPKPVDKLSSLLQSALHDAFLRTDAEFASDGCAAMVGSTAVVALVGKHKLWIANCGDSRAVLCRSGKVIQLTDDHKPEREDEAARVEKAGGQVLYWNGHRVMGVLAMSRAIGDHGLRPYVIPEPEITVLTRCDDDDFLLLASDGLWDVMANQEATNLAIRCMHRAWEKGASRKAAVRIAASVLTKAAIDRGSKDNVTVVIVDLKSAAVQQVKASVAGGGDAEDRPGLQGLPANGEAHSPADRSRSPWPADVPSTHSGSTSAPSPLGVAHRSGRQSVDQVDVDALSDATTGTSPRPSAPTNPSPFGQHS